MASDPQNHEAWLKQIAVPCPTCGAEAGEPCVKDERGQQVEIRGTHNARKQLASVSDLIPYDELDIDYWEKSETMNAQP